MKASRRLRKAKLFTTHSENETILLAKKLAQDFKGSEVVLLEGELGSGKTVFVKGIGSGLGLRDIHQVCSPSFTLLNIYPAKFTIYHLDLYRLEKNAEILDLGWEDYLGQGVVVVEWAEKIKFKMDGIRVSLKIREKDKREIKIYR